MLDFKEILESVITEFGISNNLKYKNTYIMLQLGECIERFNEGLNKNKTRVYIYMEPEKVKEYIENIILEVLNSIKSLSN